MTECVVSFMGLVHPQGGAWYFDGLRSDELHDRRIDVVLRDSAFNVRVFLHQSPFTGDQAADALVLFPLWGETESVLRGLLDSLGFHVGAALEPQFLTGTIDTRAAIGFMPRFPGVARGPEPHVSGEVMDHYAQLAAVNANIRHALADMRSALSLSDDTVFYCYRALESLREEFVDETDSRNNREKRSWERLRAALDVDQEKAKELAALAKPRRHGGNPHVTHDDRVAWLKWTRDVVAKYIEDYLPSLADDATRSDDVPAVAS
ncbi:hypothetical protein [Nocardia abscessus]|uniref:hypothetical protein n=1 Tax=Nocardia abscessus TaxID=120957 RepID=UPI002457CB49|nr:hypothetical protein [Nocardia abscessus]